LFSGGIVLRFIGGDRYALGVPARDLTDEEWDGLTDEQRLYAAGLYEVEPTAKTNAKAPAEPAGQEG
jgi:hypothetical protein